MRQLGFVPVAMVAEDVFAHAPVRSIRSENAQRCALQKAGVYRPLEMEWQTDTARKLSDWGPFVRELCVRHGTGRSVCQVNKPLGTPI